MALESLEWLGDQFREILNPAIVTDEDCKTQYVSNFCGTHVYDVNTCWGRIWKIIWAIISVFDCQGDCQKQALHKAVKMTYDTWVEKRAEIEQYVATFNQYLQERLRPSNGFQTTEVNQPIVSNDDATAAQKAIVEWERVIGRAFHEEGTGSFEQRLLKVEKVFRSILGNDIPAEFDMSYIMQNVETAHSILKLDSRVKEPMPYNAFAKLAAGTPLVPNSDDHRQLSKFIEKLAHCCNEVTEYKRIKVRDLYFALKALLQNLEPSEEGFTKVLWPVHKSLVEKQCNVFLKMDPEHSSWAWTYESGEINQITIREETFTLGPMLPSNKPREEDGHLVFELDAERVLVLSTCNSASLWIEEVEAREANWGLPVAKLLEIDDRCAIYERLESKKIEEFEWDNPDAHQKAQDRLKVIVGFIQWMIRENVMPEGLSQEMVRFDTQDQLKFLHLPPRAEFDWDTVKQFARDCSATSEEVYQEILEHSGLLAHPVARMYQQILTHAIKGEEQRVQELLQGVGVSRLSSRESFISNVQQFRSRVTDFVEQCVRKAKREYEVDSDAKLKTALGDKLTTEIEQYGLSKSPNEMDPDRLIRSVAAFQSLKLKSEEFERRKSTVIGWFSIHQRDKETELQQPIARKRLVEDRCRENGIYHVTQITQVHRAITSSMTPPNTPSPRHSANITAQLVLQT